ncbi:hypothetical protein FJT64_000739 [Amphibalanus amphitrite]|uniref:STING ligand-binding domain-containing protein n=1 Tax=Amphibalanus amphitrite TaxID=1232801 RepID=A0A6A4VT30_AMPAM|nr:hypothetical protein FJT64_000739 [Amphibalanus amphitrite]
MWSTREELLKCLVVASLTMAAGSVAKIAHGVVLHYRCRRSGQPLSDWITRNSAILLACSSIFAMVLITMMEVVPWDWLGTLALLAVTAPAVLDFLGPPDEHVEACTLCQIGKGSAYNHYFGYLRLMKDKNGFRQRLQDFQRDNGAILQKEAAELYSEAVVALAPTNGEYPSNLADIGRGVGQKLPVEVKPFECVVGCNKRSYPGLSVHLIVSSDKTKRLYVALDKIGALATLQKLRQHTKAAGLSDDECQKQVAEMIDQLKTIVASNGDLRGQLRVVRYDADEHVGDAILQALEK